MDQSVHRISIRGVDAFQLLGHNDRHLKEISKYYETLITVRGGEIILKGHQDEFKKLEKVFIELVLMLQRNNELHEADVRTVLELVNKGETSSQNTSHKLSQERPVILYTKNIAIKPKTTGQTEYFNATLKNDIVFAIGPAGTGKTFLAVATAVSYLKEKQVGRIVLARPAVEAGESLGFLPGDIKEKVDPYLRPLYDALHEMIPVEKLKKYLENQIIEIVPLAYMRGRTMNNAFVILDEAQNTTPAQMKMLLTRLGINSRAIITGDITQVDLPNSTESGLIQCREVLADIEGISFIYLDQHDVVRHKLVRDIIKAYDQHH